MTYRTIQRNGSNFYLYEVESVWDPERKKPRQHRRYLGKCDSEGNLLSAPKRTIAPEASKSFGAYYCLLSIAEQIGIRRTMTDVLGKDDADLILLMAVTRLSRPVRVREAPIHFAESFLPELLSIEIPSLERIAEVLERLGTMEPVRRRLTEERCLGDSATVFDLIYDDSPFSTDLYFSCRESRGTTLPKKNLFVAYNDADGVPFTIKTCASNITDVGSISNMRRIMQECGKRKVEFVLSSDSFNPLNIVDMLERRIDFTMNIPASISAISTLIEEASKVFYLTVGTEDFNGFPVRVHQSELKVGTYSVRAIVLQEEERRYQEMVRLNRRMDDFESMVNGMVWYEGTLSDIRRSPFTDMIDLFTLSEGPDRTVLADRRNDAVQEARDGCGKTVIITTSSDPWRKVLSRCMKRDRLNAEYDHMTDNVEGHAGHIDSPEASVGVLGVELVSLMIHEELKKRTASVQGQERIGFNRFVEEMNRLKITRMGGRWRVNGISDTQRVLMGRAGIPLPRQEYE